MDFLVNQTINKFVEKLEKKNVSEQEAGEAFMKLILLCGRNIILLHGDQDEAMNYIKDNLRMLEARVIRMPGKESSDKDLQA